MYVCFDFLFVRIILFLIEPLPPLPQTKYLVFNLVPTFVELALIIFIVLGKFDYRYALVILLMLALYVGFTYKVTEWRTKLRRSMNDLQNEANNKATGSFHFTFSTHF